MIFFSFWLCYYK